MTISSLSSYLNSQTNTNSSSSSASSVLTNSIKNATSSTKTTTTSSTTDGDSVTLSAAAQALLAKSTASASSVKNYGFTLTAKQKDQLETVLDKYKDKPQTQANYDAMQKDLKKYRLDTVNMAAKESVSTFSVKGIMLSILNGKDVSNGTAERAQALATKKSAYAEQIVADWAAVRAAATTTTETTT